MYGRGMKRLAALGVAAAVLTGCGGSSSHVKTASVQKINALDSQVEKCGLSTTPACTAAYKADLAIGVIKCGDGLSTDSSCVFAHNVYNAFRTADKIYGKPPTGLTVTNNPVACGSHDGGWRCRSRRNTAVWVDFPA
jgi:hypothetical protein